MAAATQDDLNRVLATIQDLESRFGPVDANVQGLRKEVADAIATMDSNNSKVTQQLAEAITTSRTDQQVFNDSVRLTFAKQKTDMDDIVDKASKALPQPG